MKVPASTINTDEAKQAKAESLQELKRLLSDVSKGVQQAVTPEVREGDPKAAVPEEWGQDNI